MKQTRPQFRRWPIAIAALIVAGGSGALWLARHEFVPAQEEAPIAAVQTAPEDDPGQEAATVGGDPIYLSDIEREAAAQGQIAPGDSLAGGGEVYDRILQELIDQKLLAMEATARGLEDTPEARRRLETARERILGNVLVETVISQSVTEDAIRRMYDEQVRLVELGDEVHARHILVETREEAEALRERLLAGEDFVELAFNNSIDEATRLEGGDLGYFTADTMVGPLATAAYATPIGEISFPVESEFGWHIVRVEDRRAAQRPSFESLRPRIVRFMTFDAIQALLAEMRERTEIVLLPPEPVPLDGAGEAGAPGPVGSDPMADFLDGPAAAGASAPVTDDDDGEAEPE